MTMRAAMERLKWPFSLAVLGLVLVLIEPQSVWAQAQALQPVWLALALAVTVLQTLLSAWRWRFTAARLGLNLSWRQAVGDYYLASFANQTLPGGVLGDAWRAQRHAARQRKLPRQGVRDGDDAPAAAWRAVLIERGSGQVLVVLLSLLSLLALTHWQGSLSLTQVTASPGTAWTHTGTGAILALVLVLPALLAVSRRYWRPHWHRFRSDLLLALFSPRALLPQLLSSLLIVSSYALVFLFGARAIGVTMEAPILLCLALPVLLAMLIPFSVAGWGWREAMAGGLWLSLGWPPEQGVAVSLTYGVIVFLAATPGLFVWLARPAQSEFRGGAQSPAPETNSAQDPRSTHP